LELHEDDWRQVEWIAAGLRDAVEEELASIRMIYEQQREDVGFKEVHVRKRVPSPLAGTSLTFEELMAAAGERATRLDGISLARVAGMTKDGFAVRLFSSIEIYGLSQDGVVSVAAFQNRSANNAYREDVESLARCAAEHELLLVDWCRATCLEAEEGLYRRYFVGDAMAE
jgi:hypothetical protein